MVCMTIADILEPYSVVKPGILEGAFCINLFASCMHRCVSKTLTKTSNSTIRANIKVLEVKQK